MTRSLERSLYAYNSPFDKEAYDLTEIFWQLDGEKISELNIQSYRHQIALVSQEPTLYAGTIRFNILLGAVKPMEEVTQEEIEAACRDANILDFIKSLPE